MPDASSHSFKNPSNLLLVKSADQNVGKQVPQSSSRKALFATGVEAEKIPIPSSMKGCYYDYDTPLNLASYSTQLIHVLIK